jgi:excisionase family DNA binding protein
MIDAPAPTHQVTVAEAAALLGVSVDTVKRRIRSGALHSSRTAQGRVLVDVPGEEAAPQAAESAPQTPHSASQDAPHVHRNDEVLAAITAERDWLRERVERAESEREQLRILLSNAQQSLVRALQAAPQPITEPPETKQDAQPAPEPAPAAPASTVSRLMLLQRLWPFVLALVAALLLAALLVWPR